MDCSTPGLHVHHQLPEFTQTHVHWVSDESNHLILCCPLLLPPSIFPSIRVFSKESVLRNRWPEYWSFSIRPSEECSAFFIVQLSHPHIDYWKKTIALTRRTFVGKVMSLLFNMLRLVTAFLPRSKCLLVSWLQSPSPVIFEPKKIVCHCFHCFPIYLSWNDGTRCHDHSFLNVEF